MINRRNPFIFAILLWYLLNAVSAQTETRKAPTPIYYGTNCIDSTLFLHNGLLYDTKFTFEDTIAFDKTARVFIMHEGRVFGATQPILNFYGWEDLGTKTILDCRFDYPRLPVGYYTLVIPAGTIWWKNNPSLKNDIIERPICVPDCLHAIQTSPQSGDTVTSLQKFSILFHCYVTEKTDPSVTLYEGDVAIGTYPMTVIDDYGSFDTAEANFGKTLHFKKGTNYRFIVKEDAFMTKPGVNANLSNKEICIDFTGGE